MSVDRSAPQMSFLGFPSDFMKTYSLDSIFKHHRADFNDLSGWKGSVIPALTPSAVFLLLFPRGSVLLSAVRLCKRMSKAEWQRLFETRCALDFLLFFSNGLTFCKPICARSQPVSKLLALLWHWFVPPSDQRGCRVDRARSGFPAWQRLHRK